MQITFKIYRVHDYDLFTLYQAKIFNFSKLVRQTLTAYAENMEFHINVPVFREVNTEKPYKMIRVVLDDEKDEEAVRLVNRIRPKMRTMFIKKLLRNALMDFDYFYLEDDPETENKKIQSWTPEIVRNDNRKLKQRLKTEVKKQKIPDTYEETSVYDSTHKRDAGENKIKAEDGVMDFLKKKYGEDTEKSLHRMIPEDQDDLMDYERHKDNEEYESRINIGGYGKRGYEKPYDEQQYTHREYRQPEYADDNAHERAGREERPERNVKPVPVSQTTINKGNDSSYKDLGILGMKKNTAASRDYHENVNEHMDGYINKSRGYDDADSIKTMNDINQTDDENDGITPTGDLAALGDELLGGFDW